MPWVSVFQPSIAPLLQQYPVLLLILIPVTAQMISALHYIFGWFYFLSSQFCSPNSTCFCFSISILAVISSGSTVIILGPRGGCNSQCVFRKHCLLRSWGWGYTYTKSSANSLHYVFIFQVFSKWIGSFILCTDCDCVCTSSNCLETFSKSSIQSSSMFGHSTTTSGVKTYCNLLY